MKALILMSLLFSISAWAKSPSLFVKEGTKLLDVEELIKNGEDIQAVYGFESFCYQGNTQVVANKIKAWKKTGSFFSGDGGGFVLRSVTVIHGIVTYDLNLKFEDEVVPGEFQTVIVKSCPAKK